MKKRPRTTKTNMKLTLMQQQDRRWKQFNEDLQKFMKSNDFYSLGSIYYEMADFVKKEGKDNDYLIKLGYQMRLRFQVDMLKEMKKSEIITGVEIIAVTNCAGNNSCNVCMQLNGKVLNIDEALLKNILPVKNCSKEYGCRCVYGPAC